MTRKFKVGDVYAPHDLTGVEMSKWKKLRRKGRPKRDVIDQLGINPKEHYKVCSRYTSRNLRRLMYVLELQHHVGIHVGHGSD